MSGIFPPYSLSQGHLVKPRAGTLLTPEILSPSSKTQITDKPPWAASMCVGSGDLNSGPLAFKTSTLTTGSSEHLAFYEGAVDRTRVLMLSRQASYQLI